MNVSTQLTNRHWRRRRGRGLVWRSLAAGAVGVGALALTGVTAGASGSTLSIAVFESFTGTTAPFGPTNLAGCIAGANEVNANGGVLGHHLKCLSYDDKSDPADAVSVASKMLTSAPNLTMVIGPPGNAVATTAPLITNDKIVMVSGTGSPLMDHNTDPYFYRLVPSDSITGIAMAYWAVKHGCKTAVAVFDTNSSAATVVPALKTEYKKLGGNLVGTMLVTADAPSYTSSAAQFVSDKPECAFTETDPGTAATFWSEVLQQTHKLPPIYGDQADLFGPYYNAVLPVVGSALDFTALTQAAPPPSKAYTLYKKYLRAAKSGVKDPMQYEAAGPSITNADAVILASLAMNAAHSTKPSVYRPWITKIAGIPKAGETVVHTYAEGVAALKAHKKIAYDGIGGQIVFNKYHNAAAVFSALKINDKTKGTIDLGSIPRSVLP